MSMPLSAATARRALVALLLSAAAWQIGSAGYIHAKALLAQVLLQHAWASTVLHGRPARPWPWADTWPVARLHAPAQDQNLIVLAGASGATLAFAPGQLHSGDGAQPAGSVVLAGHRDTHFAFLRHLRQGDRLRLQWPSGALHEFAVTGTRIADSRRERLALSPSEPQLVLITCYPFDAISAGGPLRYVVSARPLARMRAATLAGQVSPQFDPRNARLDPAARNAGTL